jgi:hypothetical protein
LLKSMQNKIDAPIEEKIKESAGLGYIILDHGYFCETTLGLLLSKLADDFAEHRFK